MTTEPKKRDLERYIAANLNDGEYPIPETGRMVQLKHALEVFSDFLAEERREIGGKIKGMKKNTDKRNSTYYENQMFNAALSDILALLEDPSNEK